MKNRVLFLDIDGVVLPGRAYMLPTQTRNPFVTVFDPCAVSMINTACEKQNRKIVLHSSWIRTKFMDIGEHKGDVVGHCVHQGINRDLFHEDAYCDRDESYRYCRVAKWLEHHPEVDDFDIVDDEPVDSGQFEWLRSHLIQTDFDEGITMKIYQKLSDGNFKNKA